MCARRRQRSDKPHQACDYLAIGVHELAAVSERRIERLVNPYLSGLPAFLVKKGGLNSGFMIAHCTAAALVSENKVRARPGDRHCVARPPAAAVIVATARSVCATRRPSTRCPPRPARRITSPWFAQHARGTRRRATRR